MAASDASGNQATIRIDGERITYSDAQGHTADGTITDGRVFLNNENGTSESGTIRDGRINLTGSDGSTTTGTYRDGYANVYTTPTDQELQEQREQAQERQRLIDQENYQAGYAVGQSIGSALVAGMANHQITAYCKAKPTAKFVRGDVQIDCPGGPLDQTEQDQVTAYCADNPGLWMAIGRHRVDCDDPPSPVTLKWATWELKTWQWDYRNQRKAKMQISGERIGANWTTWRQTFCGLAPSGSAYKDLGGKKQHCGS